jgi:hypothetical protein
MDSARPECSKRRRRDLGAAFETPGGPEGQQDDPPTELVERDRMALYGAATELRRPRVRSIAGELSKAPSGPGAGGTLSVGPALDRGGRLTISSAVVAMSDPPLMAWSGRSGHLGFALDQRFGDLLGRPALAPPCVFLRKSSGQCPTPA